MPHKFKVGDTVKRTKWLAGPYRPTTGHFPYMSLDVPVKVLEATPMSLTLEGYGPGHTASCFELVEEAKPAGPFLVSNGPGYMSLKNTLEEAKESAISKAKARPGAPVKIYTLAEIGEAIVPEPVVVFTETA